MTRSPFPARAGASACALAVMTAVCGASMDARQSQPASTVTANEAFEVVSIKPMPPGGPPAFIAAATCVLREGGQFSCPGATVRGLVSIAFQGEAIPIERVLGPEWTNTAQFTITAKGAATDTSATLSKRLPRLVHQMLRERFDLQAHVEPRPVAVYALILSQPDGKLGPNLHAATDPCAERSGRDARAVAPPRTPADAPPPCNGGTFRNGLIVSSSVTMSSLATLLTRLQLADRVVVDRTGLTGAFAVDLRWEVSGAQPDPTSDAGALFTALRERLGLKLEPRNQPMPAVVIDHVSMPTAN